MKKIIMAFVLLCPLLMEAMDKKRTSQDSIKEPSSAMIHGESCSCTQCLELASSQLERLIYKLNFYTTAQRGVVSSARKPSDTVEATLARITINRISQQSLVLAQALKNIQAPKEEKGESVKLSSKVKKATKKTNDGTVAVYDAYKEEQEQSRGLIQSGRATSQYKISLGL